MPVRAVGGVRAVLPALPLLAGISLAPAAAAAQEPTKEDCVAANESAQDLQRAGKLLAARAQLVTCTAKVCPRVVREDCSDRLKGVEKQLATVVLTPRDAQGAWVTDANLAIDGAPRPEALDGTPLLVDPGPHTFTVSSSGRPPATLQLSLNPGDHAKAEVVFKAVDEGEEAAPGAASEAASEAPPRSGTHRGSPALRALGWSAMGVGIGGAAYYSITGTLALSAHTNVVGECRVHCAGDQQIADYARMRAYETAADVGLAVAATGIVAGAVLLIFFPDRAEPPAAARLHPWFGAGRAGLEGAF